MTLQSLKSSLGYGGAGLNDRLPKILAELQGLTISGPLAGAGASTAIAVPLTTDSGGTGGIEYTDTILKSFIQNGTTALITDDTANVTIVDRRAKGTLTLTGVVAGDIVTVDGKNYTAVNFTPTPTNGQVGAYNFAVGATDAITAQNLAVAIMSADATITCTVATTVVTVICQTLGTVGNAITLDVSLSNGHVAKSGTTLTGGTATNAIKTTTNTTGNFVILVWFDKYDVPGQF